MNKVNVLIISNKLDFTTDYVVLSLRELGVPYVRLNIDEFSKYSVQIFLEKEKLHIEIYGEIFISSREMLKSIYYRAPTFIRSLDIPTDPEAQLYKFQWASFIRNLIIFEDALWINHPVATYKAENKLYQLKTAKQIGFEIPYTVVSNYGKLSIIEKEAKYAIKTLDPGVLKINDKEAFIYTSVITGNELVKSNLSSAPTIIQEYLYPKLDIRVTVVGNKVFAVKILRYGRGIDGDWRKVKKEELEYIPIKLPENISQLCINLVRKLGLIFGAIDLAYTNGKYYFLEVNPTGEWAWLVNTVKFPIHHEIAYLLARGKCVRC